MRSVDCEVAGPERTGTRRRREGAWLGLSVGRGTGARVIKRFIMHSKKCGFIVEHDFIMVCPPPLAPRPPLASRRGPSRCSAALCFTRT